MSVGSRITSPEDESLGMLCSALAEASGDLEAADAWPSHQLALCGSYGVYEWFLDPAHGGQGWTQADICRGYLALSAACLTTTFVITQRMGACLRIAASGNDWLQSKWLGDLLSGSAFATVGISHLTTSRRHLTQPVLTAEERGEDLVLNGYSPWVTGSPFADLYVIGATLDDGRQILIAVPRDARGISVPPPASLVGLNASQTGKVEFQRVAVPKRFLLAGPHPEVMKQGAGGNTGGLQTSTLAVGLSTAAVQYLEQQSQRRGELDPAAQALRQELDAVRSDLLLVAEGQAACSTELLRARANSLVLRATQAALVAAKGAGYVTGHVAGRWCRESLFFLVWSCPQNVMAANLCELAGLSE